MIIGRGAEAVIKKTSSGVRKERLPKSYRHPVIDEQLRKSRTRRETKVIEKLPVKGPKLIKFDDKEMFIDMEFIDAPQVRDVISKENQQQIMQALGIAVKKLHDAGIIHGDLTTSNILWKSELYFIDFGLSFFSDKLEDKAVDLHLLKETFHAKHPDLDLWSNFIDSYNPDNNLLERLETVESRGRYKQKK